MDPARDLLVIYDELDLVLGTFKIRERGSPAGHNGARSVANALGSQEWLRLRIGVGLDLPPEAKEAVGWKTAGQGLPAFAHAQGGLAASWMKCWTRWQPPPGASSRMDQAPAMNEFNRKEQ